MVFASGLFFAACGSNDDGTNSNQPKERSIIKELSYSDFRKKIWDIEAFPDSVAMKDDKPCVVKFYADWCGPCRTISPVIDSLAEINDDVRFYKVNVDKERKLAYILDIQNIPTLMYFPLKGQPSVRVGVVPAATYAADIETIRR